MGPAAGSWVPVDSDASIRGALAGVCEWNQRAPGALTRADIASAIDRGAGKGAQMRTMAGGLLTFTKSGEAIVVTAPDGASARLTGEETLASNGVLQPVDGLLVKPTAAAD